jgi:VanZ family protein
MKIYVETLKTLRHLAAPAVALAIWLLSSRSSLPMPEGIPGLDKVAHFIAYATLAVSLAWWPKESTWRRHQVLTSLIIIAIAAAYGAVDELHQSFVPGRDMSVSDWLADTLGAGFGAAGFCWRRSGTWKKGSDTGMKRAK